MNIGRVMTATLNLIFQREMAVKSHIKTPFQKIVGDFEGLKTECSEGKFEDKNAAENVLKQIEGVCGKVKNVEKKLRFENAPLLYNSTNLQADCANILGFELQKTAEIMQKLYEKGFITYPRTSAEHLPIEMKEEVLFTIKRLFDTELYGKYKPQTIEEFTKRHFDNEKVTSHTAIIPTLNRATGLSEDEFSVYDLIAKSVLRLAFPKAKYEDIAIEIDVSDYIFKSKTSVLLEKGWRIFDSNSDKNKSPNTEKTIENLTESAVLNGVFSLIEGVTEPPKHFSEASLILAMETCGQHFEDEETREIMKREKKGLGTDATRVETVQKLLKTGFICRKGKTLIPTEKGIFLMGNLKSEKLKSPETTGIWEKKLSEIADSKENSEKLYAEFIQNVNSSVAEIFEEIKNSDCEKFSEKTAENTAKCPFCGSEMRKGKKNFYCLGYSNSPKCDFVIWFENYGKHIGENDLKFLCNNGKTSIIKGFVSKSGKTYDGILVLNRETKKIEMTFPNKR
jgi:DNA topoisomerase-3